MLAAPPPKKVEQYEPFYYLFFNTPSNVIVLIFNFNTSDFGLLSQNRCYACLIIACL